MKTITPSKLVFICLMSCIALSIGALPALAGVNEWTSKGPWPNVHNVASFAVDPVNTDTMYIGTVTRGSDETPAVYKTIDGGEHWLRMDIGCHELDSEVRCLTIDPNNPNIIYTGGYPQTGLKKSVDYGETWLSINQGLNMSPSQLVVDPNNSDVLYCRSSSRGGGRVDCHKSEDGGRSWTLIGENMPTYKHFIAVDPNNSNKLFMGTDSTSENGCIYRSLDGGESWSCCIEPMIGIYNSSAECTGIYIDPFNSNIIFADITYGVQYNGFYKSEDGGNSWTKKNHNMNSVVFDPANHNNMYAHYRNGIFESRNNGETFIEFLGFGLWCHGRPGLAVVRKNSIKTIYSGVIYYPPGTPSGGMGINSGVYGYTFGPPSTSLFTESPYPETANGWFKQELGLILENDIPYRGVETYYQWNASDSMVWIKYSEKIEAIEGVNTLNYYSVDTSENLTEQVQSQIIKFSNHNTLPNANEVVSLENIVVVFNQVTTAGDTTATQTAPPAGPPSGFRFRGSTYNITTTAGYTGPITITFTYDESEVPGNENNIKLFHWIGSGWEDCTTSVDTTNNTITGRVTSLSPFAIGYPVSASGPVISTGHNTYQLGIMGLAFLASGLWFIRRRSFA